MMAGSRQRRIGGRKVVSTRAAVVALACALAAVAQAQVVAVVGGTVVPVSGPRIQNGTVLIEGERITAVGADVQVPAGARVIDASGKFVYPGMIDAWSRVGLREIGSVLGGNDLEEVGDFNPAIATVVAVNPNSDLIPVTRVNGVTTALSVPSGGRISGVGTVIDLDGWTPAEMTRVPLALLVVSYPPLERTAGRGGFSGARRRLSDEEFARRARRQVRELEEYFERAKSYAERRARNAVPEIDRQMEAMVLAMRGEMPVGFSANTSPEIMAAVRLGERFGLSTVIVGGRQAWRVADSLAARGVPVILGSVLSTPGRDDPFDAIYAQPGVLARAGVTFAFSTGDAANARNLPYHAAIATAHGLDPDTALRALTLWPARILGIDDEVGSIEQGKVANLFIADGDPLDVRTTVEQVFVRGRAIEMSTRHTKLYERFRTRPAAGHP